MRFEFATATRIIFGPGTTAEVPALAAPLGRRALLVTGSTVDRGAKLAEALSTQSVSVSSFRVSGEPTVESVQAGLQLARAEGCDLIIGLGGGSALDTGKAIAALLTNAGDPLDYLEVIGKGKALSQPPAPYIAIPTTAGTGSEVTRNAVLAAPQQRAKVSLRSPLMLPRLAVVDPELTHTLPPAVTASTGLDALTQLIEPYVCNAATPITDALCRAGIERAAWALRRAYADGGDAEAREAMALASLYSGLALANAKLGAVHGLAGPIGGMFPAPHGAVCARLLPFVTQVNLKALQERQPDSPTLQRYKEVACWLTRRPDASAEDGVQWLYDLCADLGIPPLGQYGLTPAAIPELVAQSQRANSMKGNPIPLRDEELADLLLKSL